VHRVRAARREVVFDYCDTYENRGTCLGRASRAEDVRTAITLVGGCAGCAVTLPLGMPGVADAVP
jgi:hypothetical protein